MRRNDERVLPSIVRSLVAALAVLSLAACGSARSGSSTGEPARTTLHLYVAKSPATLNPLLLSTTYDQMLSHLVYDTLLVPDARNALRPLLAQTVPSRGNGGISADGRTVIFKLRRGVRWQDGQPFTSADVAFTFARVNDPRVNVPSRTGFDRIASVATPDPYTVVVTLREAFTPFVVDAGYQYAIVPKHLLEHSSDFNRDPLWTNPIGTGPYRLRIRQFGYRIEYDANAAYFGGAPKIPHLTVAEVPDQNTVALELRTRQLDLADVESAPFAQLRTVPGLRTATEPSNNFIGYAINTTSPILRDVRVRRAFSMLIDRPTLIAKTTYGTGTPAYADLPAQMWTQRELPNPYGYDPARANALLDAAGWRRDATGLRHKDGAALRLRNIDYTGYAIVASIDAQVAQWMRAAGIDWSTKYYSYSLYYEAGRNGGPLRAGNYDTAAFGWSGSLDTENDQIYACANREPAGWNAARYCSPEMDALQHDALTTSDAGRRAADVVKIERLAVTDVPYIFVYRHPWRLVWNPQLERRHSSLGDVWYDIRNWSFRAPR